MDTERSIKRISASVPTIEGAGVYLRRAFGFSNTEDFDPFLLLDDFRSDSPDRYIKGFPWHPHRGIETITYMLRGEAEHGDSMGNKGVIKAGDAQWMTAGSGVIHQEMPKGDHEGKMWGFQLWANLPASKKMTDPRYRDIKRDMIPEIKMSNGVVVKVICGTVDSVSGPVNDIFIAPEYIDVRMPPGTEYIRKTNLGDTVFAYVYDGEGIFQGDPGSTATNRDLVLFDDGDMVTAKSQNEHFSFIMVSGRPLREPVAWRGPIVMNTMAELETAFREYENGTFIKRK